MKWIIAILCMVLLTACAQTTTTQTVETTPPAQQTYKEIPAAAASVEDLKTETLAKNDATMELVIPLNIRKCEVGETLTFGAIFNLVNRQPGTFLAKVSFIEARDKNYNPIEVNKDAVNSWVEAPASFTAEEGKPSFIPIVVKPTGSVSPGTYVFEVQLYKLEEGMKQKLDAVVKNINVKIE